LPDSRQCCNHFYSHFTMSWSSCVLVQYTAVNIRVCIYHTNGHHFMWHTRTAAHLLLCESLAYLC
jgi:hypothetical protein